MVAISPGPMAQARQSDGPLGRKTSDSSNEKNSKLPVGRWPMFGNRMATWVVIKAKWSARNSVDHAEPASDILRARCC